MVSHRRRDRKDSAVPSNYVPGWRYRHLIDLAALVLTVTGVLLLLVVGSASGGVITTLAGILAGIFRAFMQRNQT
ncbi:hypothetical protein [Nocardia wallacei]|uniref:hypothetical protein n=1 Tax=Nocardia wallacei TaxID=480035 RepID=UPI002453847D|nr:hypothetical protein [Nocardia wallacei]